MEQIKKSVVMEELMIKIEDLRIGQKVRVKQPGNPDNSRVGEIIVINNEHKVPWVGLLFDGQDSYTSDGFKLDEIEFIEQKKKMLDVCRSNSFIRILNIKRRF